MWVLLGTTLSTSFLDCLNPTAIAQQMLLQAMVKRKRHALFFILGIGLANYLLGLAVYYGILSWVTQLVKDAAARFPLYTYGTEAAVGLLCAAIGFYLICKTRRSGSPEGREETKTPSALTPLSLFCMGAAFCGLELTSALPYFGFLTVLAGYGLAFPYVAVFLLLYDFIYILPLLLVYWGYNRLRGTAFITRLERVLGRVAAYVVPVVLTAVGVLLLVHGAYSLI